MDTVACTVCGLVFDSVAGNLAHASKSKLCCSNLIGRGVFLSGDGLKESLAAAASFRSDNKRSGKAPKKVAKLCVRSFGPFPPVFDANNNVIVPSRKGHPLGEGRPLFLPPRLLEAFIFDEIDKCPAGRLKVCTSLCLLCHGS